ncbi:MAG: nicotinate phosphoribosyltransferase [Desulfobacterales bacterium]|nr:nicotinate phosphoribosyltransferase [Desulfobacterales bacterium]
MLAFSNPGPLFTDLYELTMAQAYFDNRMFDTAAFSLFIRDYPKNRSYFVAAGLEEALKHLEDYTFSHDELDYLKSIGLFTKYFLSYLKKFRFTGTVRAMPEGSIFFANEPVLEVSAPLIEAQILETFLINTIGMPTLIATKAARCIHATQGRPVIDFAARRTQGHDAAIKVARSAYIAGFTATSNVLAGKLYGIPVSGTMAHSYVTSFASETEAFAAYAKTYPDKAIFLIDTYDTLDGARHAAKVALEMKKQGHQLIGVRLDSGDMVVLSRQVRKILDDAGLPEVKIFASSGFDEYQIAGLIQQGAMIDAFGVGTRMGVSADAPYLDIVYKMVHFKGKDIRKLSPGKVNLPGEKQVFRKTDENSRFLGDIIGLKNEAFPDRMVALLKTVMENGRITEPSPSLDQIRNAFARSFLCLDDTYKSLDGAREYPVDVSEKLMEIPDNIKIG